LQLGQSRNTGQVFAASGAVAGIGPTSFVQNRTLRGATTRSGRASSHGLSSQVVGAMYLGTKVG
jgi:hypothetical protein